MSDHPPSLAPADRRKSASAQRFLAKNFVFEFWRWLQKIIPGDREMD
jgi:hypothetical protein